MIDVRIFLEGGLERLRKPVEIEDALGSTY